jgi:hypothetical protein
VTHHYSDEWILRQGSEPSLLNAIPSFQFDAVALPMIFPDLATTYVFLRTMLNRGRERMPLVRRASMHKRYFVRWSRE